jgi:retinol dehydrogenase 12
MACRDPTKGQKAQQAVLASKGREEPPGSVEVWQLDMADNASMLAFGDRMRDLPSLHVLVANAGIDTTTYEKVNGWESHLAINVIATFLVALLAVPKLRETSKALRVPTHLVLTGSVVHIFAKHQYLVQPEAGHIFESLNNKKHADMDDRYNLSKLLDLLGARQLAQSLENRSTRENGFVVVNCVNPGWCKTELFRTHDGGLGGRIGLRLIGRTAEEGSRSLVHAATAGKESHGKYLSENRIKPESTWVRSDECKDVEKRVWKEICTILESIKPGVTHL